MPETVYLGVAGFFKKGKSTNNVVFDKLSLF